MTNQENERLAKVEVELSGVREDLGDIKAQQAETNRLLAGIAQRGHDRHTDIEKRIAVLEDRVNLLRYLVIGAGGSGAGSLVWHGMNALGG